MSTGKVFYPEKTVKKDEELRYWSDNTSVIEVNVEHFVSFPSPIHLISL